MLSKNTSEGLCLPERQSNEDIWTSDDRKNVAIEVAGLGKCYPIYSNPRDRLLQMFTRGRKRLFREFWALSDVSFNVRKGETVGIIGSNGSGKSTLLQMICGTLNPSTGTVNVNGKVAALLELGAGFNPEFTGRENVYMASSLYGLTRTQVDRRFEHIAAFADIGEHLDQPVKTYSSGMYVRLAFAVIANVDADILVIDEALAVGDAVFTQKCMRFIRQFQRKGTLLFVSHDMGSVLNLCEKAIWLVDGRVQRIGESKDVSEAYLQYTLQRAYGPDTQLAANQSETLSTNTAPSDHLQSDDESSYLDYCTVAQVQNNLSEANGWKSGSAEIIGVKLHNLNADSDSVLRGGENVKIEIIARAQEDLRSPVLGFLVKDRLGQDLFGENTLPFTDRHPRQMSAGQTFSAEFTFVLPMLPNGQYSVMASLADGDLYNNIQHHWLHDALIINVSSSQVRWGLMGINFKQISLNSVI